MKSFSGFPEGKVTHVRLPEPVFAELLPLIDDLDELKLTLHIFWLLSKQKGGTPYVRRSELASDKVLLAGLGDRPAEALGAAVDRAVRRGTLLALEVESDGASELVYYVNTPKGRAAAAEIAVGDLPEAQELPARPNVFTLYEENIGMLTPLLAEELREAEQIYAAAWIEEAVREAVTMNKRSWKYVRAILERWSREGRGEQTDRRSSKADRQRYLRWKTG